MKKEIVLTAFTFEEKSLGDFSIGEKVVIKKVENEFDNYALEVLFPDGVTTGFIGNKPDTTVTGVTGKEVYDELPKEITATIVDKHKGAIRHRTALSVSIELESKKSIIGKDIFELCFKGTYKKYPKKVEVMREIVENNEKPTVVLKAKNEDIIAFYQDLPIGILNEKSMDVNKVSIVKSFIENSKDEISGRAIKLATDNRKDIVVELIVDRESRMSLEETANRGKKSIATLIDDIVSQGIASKEKCESVKEYLENLSVKERIIRKVFSSYKKYPEELEKTIPNPMSFYDDYLGLVKKNLLYINIKKHLRIVGAKGTGKNKLIETLAWIYNRPLLKLSVSREVDKLDLLGSQKLEDGNVVFEPGIVPIAMEHGCILNLDEINTANPGLLTLLHSATDWSSSLYVPGYKSISADENFCLISTMNENYNGTMDLNQATKDRFTTIRVPYPEKISRVLRSQVDCEEAIFDVCDNIFNEILNAVKDGRLSDECITVRGYLSAIEVYNEGMDIEEALKDNIANAVDDESERLSIEEAIDLACG